MQPNLPTFCSWRDALYVSAMFYSGALPYIKIPFESLPAPFLTRDWLSMRLKEAREKEGVLNKAPGLLLMAVVLLQNKTSNALWTHLNQRGVMTSYWVINEDDELDYVLKNTTTGGIMTDRPAHVKKMIEEYERTQ